MSNTNTRSKTQWLKTLLFVTGALATILLAGFTRPPKISGEPNEIVGQPLFPAFTDPLDASGLEVLSFDEAQGRLQEFKVAQLDGGIWVIPSHQNYPADAQNRLEQAATMFVDLQVINVVSEAEGDHATYGVVEPNRDVTSIGDEGIGKLVTVYGRSGASQQSKLAELVIGEPVKGLTGQHFVRLPGKPLVYQVKIDPSRLSTKFQDWVQTDLLNLNQWDIKSLTLKDYSVEIGKTEAGQLAISNYDQRLEITVHEEDGTWMLERLAEFREGELRPIPLSSDEELNGERLEVLRNSLDDLKIVDVQRKPEGLGADLKADKGFLNNSQGMRSLVERGFYPVGGSDEGGQMELWSSDGELLINTMDGVQYILRFGQIASVEEEAGEGDSANDEASGGDNGRGVNRFLFVTVRTDESLFPLPDLEALPEGADAEGAADNAELQNEVQRIEKANQRKMDERADRIVAAQRKVSELNYRFADWYYIISDEVFRKVHLGRNDLIRVSAAGLQSGTGIEAFRMLQSQGLRPASSQ